MTESFSGEGGPQIPQVPIIGRTHIERGIQTGKSSSEIAQGIRGVEEIGYGQLPEEVRNELPENIFNQLISQSLLQGVKDTERLMEYHAGLYSQPESEQFKEEIENSHFRLDEETGINYAFHRLNRDKSGKPLVVKLLWSAGANSRSSRSFLSALSSKTDQPIIVIDSAATGETSIPDRKWMKKADFDTMADSEKRVLDAELEATGLSNSNIDLLGVSMGGIQAAKLAERYGSLVDKLITFSTPGLVKKNPIKFATGFAIDEQAAGARIIEEDNFGMKEDAENFETLFGKTGISLDRDKLPGLFKVMPRVLKLIKPIVGDLSEQLPPEQFSSEQVPAFFRFYYLMTRAPLADLPEKLAAETQWIDLVGSKDAIIGMPEHIEAVRERNKTLRRKNGRVRGDRSRNFQHSSSVHILGSASHSWFATTTEVADKAAEFLKK